METNRNVRSSKPPKRCVGTNTHPLYGGQTLEWQILSTLKSLPSRLPTALTA
jgi:hypothetical protein